MILPLTDIHTNLPVALCANAFPIFMVERADRRIGTECAAFVSRYAS